MNQKELIKTLREDLLTYKILSIFLFFLFCFMVLIIPDPVIELNTPTQPGTYITDNGNYLFSFNMTNPIELQLAEIILQACVVNDMECSNIQQIQWRTN